MSCETCKGEEYVLVQGIPTPCLACLKPKKTMRYGHRYEMLEDPSETYFDVSPECIEQLLLYGAEFHGRVTTGFPKGTKIVGFKVLGNLSAEGQEGSDFGRGFIRVFVANEKDPLAAGGVHITVEDLRCTKT